MQIAKTRFDIRQASRKILIGMTVLAAVDLAFYLAFTRPAVQDYRRLEATTRPDFDELSEREKVVVRLEGYQEGLRQAEEDLRRLRSEVLSTRNQRLVEVQEELAALCDEFHIDLESVSYNHKMLFDERLDRLEMVVPLEGGYVNLRKFMQAVEQSDKFLLVERVALGRGKQGGRLLDLSITLVTYFNAPEDLMEQREARGRRRG